MKKHSHRLAGASVFVNNGKELEPWPLGADGCFKPELPDGVGSSYTGIRLYLVIVKVRVMGRAKWLPPRMHTVIT